MLTKWCDRLLNSCGDRAAIKFAEAFYQGLGNELSIEDACELGRIAIQLAGIPEFLTPILKTRQKSLVESTISSQQEEKQDNSSERTPYSNLFNISNSDIKNVSGSVIINYHESSS